MNEFMNEFNTATNTFTLEDMRNAKAVAIQGLLLQTGLHLKTLVEPMEAAEAELKITIEKAKTDWEEKHSALIADFQATKKTWGEYNAQMRALVVEAYNAMPKDQKIKTNIFPGWGVMVGKELVYKEGFGDTHAIQWAIDHNHKGLLKLDATKFKTIAETVEIDFVKFEDKVTAKITAAKEKKS